VRGSRIFSFVHSAHSPCFYSHAALRPMKNSNAFLSATLSAGTVLVLSAAILLATPDQALAYIDPGAGSMLVQLILGGIAGLLLVGRLFWVGLKGWVTKPFTRSREQLTPPLTESTLATPSCCAKSERQSPSTAATSKDPQHAL
jgi:hypothetical protein